MSFNMKKIILIFLFVLYLSSITHILGNPVNNQVSLQPQHQMDTTKCYQKISNSYTDIDPISIGHNSSFGPQGFIGSGTSTDPYILENCRITNNTESNLIEITNTNAYFIIRNNFLDGINKSPTGIFLYNVANGVVEINTIINTDRAIHSAWYSNNNVITNNTIKNNQYGITASSSHNSTYTYNNIFSNTEDGIYFREIPEKQQASRSLSGNIISSNTIYDNDGYHGIFIECGTNNLVMNNSIENNFGTGISINDGEENTIYNNTIIGNKGAGVGVSNGLTGKFLLKASSNITSNTIMNNHEGLSISSYRDFKSEGGPNNVSKNIITQNNYNGIFVSSSNYTITENIIYDNEYIGIEIDANSSIVKWNDFIGNLIEIDSQALCSGYHNNFIENYWDDWTYPDTNEDGIVDNPYPIYGGYDVSPLTAPHNAIPEDLHFLTRPRILYPKLEGFVDGSRIAELFKGTITVKWCSVTDSSGHSVSYTLYYSDNENGLWEELATDLTTPEYEWDTTTVEDYLDVYLKVVAECSEGVTSEYSSIYSFEIENSSAAHGWSFTMLTLTLCLLVFASRRKKSK